MLRTLLAPCARGLLIAAGLLVAVPAAARAGDAATDTVLAAGGNGRTAGESSGAGRPALMALGSGFGRESGSPQVRGVQRRLNRLGFAAGPVDGLFGPRTKAAVVAFQRAHGLAADGIVGRRTTARLRRTGVALSRGAGFQRRNGSAAVRRLQRRLKRLGHRPGPVDGLFGPRTQAAVVAFQAAEGLQRDGIAGPRTRTRLRKRFLRDARQRAATPTRDERPSPAEPTVVSEPPADPPATPTRTSPSRDDSQTGTDWLVLAIAVALVSLLAIATVLYRRGRRPHDHAQSPAPAPAGGEDASQASVTDEQKAASVKPVMGESPAHVKDETQEEESPRAPAADEADTAAPVDEDARQRPPRVVTLDVRPGQADTDDARGETGLATPVSTPAENAPLRAIGYASITALEPRAQLAEQQERIRAACDRHGLELVGTTNDVERVTRSQEPRPGLEAAFQTIANGEASLLVVAELARLSRSAVELGDIVAQFERAGARLIVIDIELDTGTPEGRLAARALRTAGQLEERHARERGRSAPAGPRRTAPAGGRRPITDRSRMPVKRNGPEEER